MLDTLRWRPRGRTAASILARVTPGRARGRAGSPGRPSDGGATAAATPVTSRLLARLSSEDRAEVVQHLEGETAELWAQSHERARAWLTLALGVHHRVPAVLAKTGLSAEAPPPDVHAMARGPLAAGGDYVTSDRVVAALERVGGPLPEGARVLDFGCSSARHLRPLLAARPDVRWSGCDPNGRAVEWAQAHFPDLDLLASSQSPPLPRADGSFDAAFAVSIWTHFGPAAAEAWLGEMHRLLRPGGHLLLTVHGFRALAAFFGAAELAPSQLREAARALPRVGHWFAATFGPDGDWGVRSPDWGTAFLTLEWLAVRACPAWRVALFLPGAVEGVQDVVVLERGAGG